MMTFLRRLEILNFLKSRHTSTGTEQILQHLIDAGYLDSQSSSYKSRFRLIQRDLAFLLGDKTPNEHASYKPEEPKEPEEYDNDFGLSVERGLGKSLHWRLDPYQQLNYDFERMPAFMALALSVTQKHLTQVLPTSTQHELKRIFLSAESKLQKSELKLTPVHYQRLTDAVEFFQRGQHLQAPHFEMSTLDTVYRAILSGKRLRFTYRGQTGKKEYELHPFGVAIMLPKLYLIGIKHEDIKKDNTQHNEKQYRSFLIHKIETIELSPLPNYVPDDFKLKSYLNDGNMDVLLDREDPTLHTLKLELNGTRHSNLLADLRESPISPNQSLTQIDEHTWLLQANVRRTIQLQNWLLSLGSHATVLAPETIRNDLLRVIGAMQANYSN